MKNIIPLDDFRRQKQLHGEVIPLFENLQLDYQYLVNEKDALFIIKTDAYLFMFLTFIDQQTATNLPTVYQRFYDIKPEPRTIHKEWVVEHVFKMKKRDTMRMLEKINKHSPKEEFVLRLKEKIKENIAK